MALDPEVRARLRGLFETVREGARDREARRIHPRAEIAELVGAGFTALRVPREFGGHDATLPELFELLIELGAADPNIPQALRGHLGFVERLRARRAAEDDHWYKRIVAGELFGNAQAESGPATTVGTRLRRVGGVWRLTGTKFYTTGTLYADWAWTVAADEQSRSHGVIVSTHAPGVSVLDDWTGFGQRITGSGTAVFDDVEIPDAHVYPPGTDPPWQAIDYRLFLHLLLQATMAGIGVDALRDAVGFVRGRTRSFGVPGESLPRHDPRVHVVVGEVASRVAAARAIVRDVVAAYAAVRDDVESGAETDDEVLLDRYVEVQIRQFEAQQIVVADIVRTAGEIFEVGGASAVLVEKGFDRHWRNARTLASHNPAIFRKAAIGDYLLNGTQPEQHFR